jgi:hypothetical protein
MMNERRLAGELAASGARKCCSRMEQSIHLAMTERAVRGTAVAIAHDN